MPVRLLCTALIAAGLASPLGAARTEPVSWGKVGVSIEQYRRDAIECGRSGYYLDVSKTEAAQVFKRATRELEANEADLQSPANSPGMMPTPEQQVAAEYQLNNIVARSGMIVEGTRPAERMKTVGALMQGTVDDCLRNRGYVRFQLTPAQRKRLGRLHLGSPERHAFLYSLATDPQVLAAQAR